MLNYNPTGLSDAGVIDSTAGSVQYGGSPSSQVHPYFWLKKAIVRARKLQFFMPLASVTNMPKNYGQTIKVYEYVPLLDDRNVNSQGIDATGVTSANGNLYGSSRDVGTITSKLPTLSEDGGRVNRVGFTRLLRQGSLLKFGFFTEFTKDSIEFDSDPELMDHLSTELMNGAVQLTEAVLQRDLLAAAGVVLYAGAAVSQATITAEPSTVGGITTPASIISYANFVRLDQILTDNRSPKQTTVITGSRMIDTTTIPSARIMFVSGDLLPTIKSMVDFFGNKAFIPVQHYASAGHVLNGEIGSIDQFRIVQVPEMLHWSGAGAAVGTNPGFRATTVGGTSHYDVYPLLVLGEDSWTTIGFQSDGKTVKFSVLTKMPGREMATTLDPYGEKGFSSIKWFYGLLVKRPERIALMLTVAPM